MSENCQPLNPMPMAVDHEARSRADRLSDRQDAHERFCEERARRAELFESEMKSSTANLTERLSNGVARIHQKMEDTEKERSDRRIIEAQEQAKLATRQNVLWLVFTTILVGVVGAAVKLTF